VVRLGRATQRRTHLDTPLSCPVDVAHSSDHPPAGLRPGWSDPVAGGVPVCGAVRLRACAACVAYDGAPVIAEDGAAVAQKVQTLFIDDLDGSTAEGMVRFGLDGTEYEIDLNAGHAQQLRDALSAYVRAGRRISGGSGRPARGGRRGSASGLNTTEVREWAKAQGIEVKDRGRVPAELVVKFKAATGQ